MGFHVVVLVLVCDGPLCGYLRSKMVKIGSKMMKFPKTTRWSSNVYQTIAFFILISNICITLLFKGHWRSKNWKKVRLNITFDNQRAIKCISKDCIFYADFKYVYNIIDQRSFEVKKMEKGQILVRNDENHQRQPNSHKSVSSVHYCKVPYPWSGKNVCLFFENFRCQLKIAVWEYRTWCLGLWLQFCPLSCFRSVTVWLAFEYG